MNILIYLVDPQPYSRCTVGQATANVAKQLGYEYVEIWPREYGLHSSDKSGILICEAAVFKNHSITTSDVHKRFPNCKIVALGSDTIHFLDAGHFEFDRPTECDLVLETMDEARNKQVDMGIKADVWSWSISETFVAYYSEQRASKPMQKTNDFIGLYRGQLGYRQEMADHLKNSGYQCILGDGKVGYDPNELYEAYAKSKFVLGTTSPSWTHKRTMKGFRDWIGPPCGTVLIYDDHPDVLRRWPCPTYAYGQFRDINQVYDLIDYDGVLALQQAWVKANTIESQFIRLFQKHGIT